MEPSSRSARVRSRCFDAFEAEFVRAPDVFVRAPGRVNLIGEHTDYTGGLVLPCAIDRELCVAAAKRSDRCVRVHAADLRRSDADTPEVAHGPTTQFQLDDAGMAGGFVDYVRGAVASLRECGVEVGGLDLAIASDLPIGAGLSSSAALCVALCRAMLEASKLDWSARDVAAAAHRAESHFVGVGCGILDPFAVALGRRGHALRIDCRSHDTELIPFPSSDVAILISDSGVSRRLAGGVGEQDAGAGYRKRVAQCAAALAAVTRVSREFRDAHSLRDVAFEWLPALEARMDPLLFRRLRHVVSENLRVDACVEALRCNGKADVEQFGRLLREGHASLRDDYEVSIPELDALCDDADRVTGVFGSRMTGAGFGGSALHVVAADAVESASEEIAARFHTRFGRTPTILVVNASDGASVESNRAS